MTNKEIAAELRDIAVCAVWDPVRLKVRHLADRIDPPEVRYTYGTVVEFESGIKYRLVLLNREARPGLYQPSTDVVYVQDGLPDLPDLGTGWTERELQVGWGIKRVVEGVPCSK